MIAALAKAAQVFNEKLYVEKAEKAVDFILNVMMKKNGELLHRYKKGEAEIKGYADDYAFLVLGLIELYQTTYNSRYLKISIDLNNYLLDHFWDCSNGGLFFTSDTGEKLLTRNKEFYDGAIPSANSITMYNLVRLARITGNLNLEDKAKKIGKAFSSQIKQIPSGYTQMMSSLDFEIGPTFEIVIIGNKDREDTQKIIETINSIYLPNKVVILKEPDTKDSLLEGLVSIVKEYSQIKNMATVYVCKNQRCLLPTTSIEKMMQLLEK